MTTKTTTAATSSLSNVVLLTGLALGAITLILPAILVNLILPSAPQYAMEIFSASIILSYATAGAAGVVAFGGYLRYKGK